MAGKRLVLYIVLAVLVLGALWLVAVAARGVSVRGGSQGRGEARGAGSAGGGSGSAAAGPGAGSSSEPVGGAAAGGRGAGESGAASPGGSSRDPQVSTLERRLQDLMARHPDYPLEEARKTLQALQELPLRPRAKLLEALQARVGEVEIALREKATGLSPGVPGWERTLGFKTFSPNGFRDYYESSVPPGLRPPGTRPPARAADGTLPAAAVPLVTGDPAADRRIAELALARGYRLRGEADESRLEQEDGHRLQPEAFAAWRALQAAARADGVELELVSAYRSVERQRGIFLRALEEAGTTGQGGRAPSGAEIASGQADGLVESVLRESSPPGFSRHHTGCTIDITDAAAGLEFTQFGRTDGYRWISRYNFLNAKRFGFLPSYPAGATGQGPDPEPWEFVWVGVGPLESPSAVSAHSAPGGQVP